MLILSYIAMALSITGNLYVNRKHIAGMWLWLLGSALWIVYAAHSHTWSQVGMFSVYTVLNIDGILRWRRK